MPLLVAIVIGLLTLVVGGLASLCTGRNKALTAVVLGSVPLLLWAIHYNSVLDDLPRLTDDQQWHKLYMQIILYVIPTNWLVLGITGFALHQRAYYQRYQHHADGE